MKKTTMNLGYYMLPSGDYPIEVVGDGRYRSMRGDDMTWALIYEGDLKPATLKDLIQWGGDFDESKLLPTQINWASSEDEERWDSAESEDDAIVVARNEGLKQIWICDKPRPADPREVTPDAECIIDLMLDNCDDDNSMFHSAKEGGWLDNVTAEQKTDLSNAMKRTICAWLIRHDHWPTGFMITGQDVRCVEVKDSDDGR
jgi:hypothetical protein